VEVGNFQETLPVCFWISELWHQSCLSKECAHEGTIEMQACRPVPAP
jgi:hypothetical protein